MIINSIYGSAGGLGEYPVLSVYVSTGATVTATCGSYTLTGTSTMGICTFNKIKSYGVWGITATYEGCSKSTSVTIDEIKVYEATISNFIPSLTVYGINGASVTATCGSYTLNGTIASGSCVFSQVPSYGTWSITTTYSGTTFNNSINITDGQAYTVYVIPATLNSASWDTIHKVANLGISANYWSVGDYKEIAVSSGTVDQYSITAGTYRAVIMGINHNNTYENTNSIDFCIGQNTSGKDIAFCTAQSSGGTRMNTSDITTGGWTGSAMYKTYLPQFYNLLPSDLKSAIITPKKYTHNYTGGSGNNSATYVTLSEDSNYKLFLMAEFEIFGSRSYANSYEQNKQAQYMYYKASPGLAKSKVRYCYTSTGTSCRWWERSAGCNTSYTDIFCIVYTDGSATDSVASGARGLVPCFKV